MGHEIEKAASERNHSIVATPDREEAWETLELTPGACDVVIDFSNAASSPGIVGRCLKAGIPVVSGTTGWMAELDKVRDLCRELRGAFFYAPNFSIGVYVFSEINRRLASLLNDYDYKAVLNEIHHVHKLDAPSGTAIALANDILACSTKYTGWKPGSSGPDEMLGIHSERTGEVPGTHIVQWNSPADAIEIRHTAHNRSGFAIGAVLAAEWLPGKTGVFGMKDMLNFKP